MPYENEESSLIASARFNKQILNEPQFHSNFQFNDKHKKRSCMEVPYSFMTCPGIEPGFTP